MFCPNCGSAVSETAEKCPFCDFDLTARDSAPDANGGQEYRPPYGEQDPYGYGQGYDPRSRDAYSQYSDSQRQYFYQDGPYYSPKPVIDPQQNAAATSVMIFGIIGAALANTFWLSFIGIIFSAIGCSKAKKYLQTYVNHTVKSRIGKILSVAGLAINIVFTVFAVVYIFVLAKYWGSISSSIWNLNL